MSKKRILLYWDYRRRDLLLPFIKLEAYFEWTLIFWADPEDDHVSNIPYRKIYFNQYKTPYALLGDIKPDAIVFLDLSNINAVALNIAAKNKKIYTAQVDHGLKLDFAYYRNLEIKKNLKSELPQPAHAARSKKHSKLKTLWFYFSALRPGNIGEVKKLMLFFLAIARSGGDTAFAENKFDLRRPNWYFLFSRQQFPYYQQRDGAKETDVKYFGNPVYDNLLQALSNDKGEYFLLLDDGELHLSGIDTADKNRFILKLNEFATGKNKQLLVKLHPLDFEQKDLAEHSNIRYIKEANIESLINDAAGVFAISTSLIVPLIFAKKVILFAINNPIIDLFRSYGVRFLDYKTFDPANLNFEQSILQQDRRAAFEEDFLYRADGQSLGRLKALLFNITDR